MRSERPRSRKFSIVPELRVPILKALLGPTLSYRLRRAAASIAAPPRRARDVSGDWIDFVCNICGTSCSAPLSALLGDGPSCWRCGSSGRFRAVIHGLSRGLWGEDRSLPDFPTEKRIAGIGMTDWIGYACRLERKLSYTNTFYHKEPRIDVTDGASMPREKYDFILSSDVMEHVRPPVTQAFANVLSMLKPGGLFVVTVPCEGVAGIEEHFPNLNEYQIVRFRGSQVLLNCTHEGRLQVFENLIFHGGPGEALEVRRFSRDGLIDTMRATGFVQICALPPYPAYGILDSDPPLGATVIGRRPSA